MPALLACTFNAGRADADALAVVDPLPVPGPYTVGCSNVAQDFTRLQPGENAQDYWEGTPDAGRARYVTQLLSDPADALLYNVNVPDDRELFDNHATQQVAYLLLVCYPTTPDNPRAGYPLPTGDVVPHMQQGADAPLWADDTARWPVLLFSHGLVGSPISDHYVVPLEILASYGYVVVAPFHGDPRFADVSIDDLSDALFALLHFNDFVEMQAIRPLSMVAALDFILARPEYRDHVDASRVAGFGASLGGETLLLQAGAALTTTIGMSSRQVVADPRLKAIVGYVPYFGQSFLPAFGRDQNGLDGFNVPFLGISGLADTTAPIGPTLQGVERFTNSRDLVGLVGVEHGFDVPSAPDIFTWTLTFAAAHVNDDRLARARIARMTSVRGGGDDVLLIDYTAPAPPAVGENLVTEYFSDELGDYFLTAFAGEAAALDAGLLAGWSRTGFQFKAFAAEGNQGIGACRFFGRPSYGPAAHFYTIDPAECAFVKAWPGWIYEGIAFAEDPPAAGDCPANRVPVVRLYNNGMNGQIGHRYLTSHSEMASMVIDGWRVEGTVFCAAP